MKIKKGRDTTFCIKVESHELAVRLHTYLLDFSIYKSTFISEENQIIATTTDDVFMEILKNISAVLKRNKTVKIDGRIYDENLKVVILLDYLIPSKDLDSTDKDVLKEASICY